MKTYRKAEAIVTQYDQDLAEWEQAVKNGQKPAEKQHRPPERQSVRNRLRQLQEEGKQNSQPKQRKNPKTGKIIITTAGRPALRSYIYHSTMRPLTMHQSDEVYILKNLCLNLLFVLIASFKVIDKLFFYQDCSCLVFLAG